MRVNSTQQERNMWETRREIERCWGSPYPHVQDFAELNPSSKSVPALEMRPELDVRDQDRQRDQEHEEERGGAPFQQLKVIRDSLPVAENNSSKVSTIGNWRKNGKPQRLGQPSPQRRESLGFASLHRVNECRLRDSPAHSEENSSVSQVNAKWMNAEFGTAQPTAKRTAPFRKFTQSDVLSALPKYKRVI